MHLESYCGFFRRLALYRRTAGSGLELSTRLREGLRSPVPGDGTYYLIYGLILVERNSAKIVCV